MKIQLGFGHPVFMFAHACQVEVWDHGRIGKQHSESVLNCKPDAHQLGPPDH